MHHAVLLSEILKRFLDRCLNSQSFSWTVDSRTSRNGLNRSKKNSVATMPGEFVMDIEILDSYIHCEYFSIARREITCLLTSLYGKKSRVFFDHQELKNSSDG